PAEGGDYGSAELPPPGVRPAPELLARLQDNLPPQPRHVAVVFAGAQVPKQPGAAAVPTDWRDAVAAASAVAAAVGATAGFRQAVPPGFHPTRSAEVLVGDTVVGLAGELLPGLVEDVSGRIAAVELDVDALIAAAPAAVSVRPISPMPAATQDLSLVVGVEVAAADVLGAVREGSGALLEAIALVDDYRGAGLPERTKSLTFALRFRAEDRTLTAAEATAAKEAGVALAAERTGARLRE
ncbi:MAG: phenylalanyl-tRNA synthetase beta chain, partial [Microbacteriaceae bacterium]|nr:phenylalanyl-tRNA synthetase beta chain [Microbacteriaceae bacterium]